MALTVGSGEPDHHFLTNRGETVSPSQRYRLTRPAFDIVSVFGSLRAHALPTSAFIAVLAARGYSETNVRTQLNRLVHRGLLVRAPRGGRAVFSLGSRLLASFDALSGAGDRAVYAGRLTLLLTAVPESDRAARDRLDYLARRHGFGRLRPGAFVSAAAEAPAALVPELAALPAAAWADTSALVPRSHEHARELIARAFDPVGLRAGLRAAAARTPALGDALAAGPAPSDAALRSFGEHFFRAAALVLDTPALPAELTPGVDLAADAGALMGGLRALHAAHIADRLRTLVADLPGAEHIEWAGC